MFDAVLFGVPQRKRTIFGAQRPIPMLLKDGWMFRFSCSTVLLMFVVLSACSDSANKVSSSGDAGFDLSEGVDTDLPDMSVSADTEVDLLDRGTCEQSGGTCQSPDLPCDSTKVFAGYELCGDQPNNSCCLPTEPASGVVGAFSTSGSGYVESTVLHVEAFASGGAFITMSHRGELVIPVANGQFSSTPAADVDEVLGLWVDPQGVVQNVVRLALGRADVQVFPLRRDVAVALRSAPDTTVLPDGGAYKDGAWRSLLLVADSDGGIRLRAVLTAEDGAAQFSAISESPANELFIAAQQTGAAQSLEIIDGATTPILELATPPSEWGVRSWFVRVRGASNDLRFLGGNGTVHINAMAPTNDGGLWICGDVGGYGSDMTVVLGEGMPSETTLTAISPDDDPSSDVFFARLGASGEVRSSWLQYGYNNSLKRPCSMAIDGDDLLVSVSIRAQYTAIGGIKYTWTQPDGVEASFDARYDANAQILARYSAAGQLHWFTEYAAGIEAPRVWAREGQFRLGLSAPDETVIFKGAALESTLQIQPTPRDGVSTRLSFDGATGAPAALAGGGVSGGTLLANGALLVAHISREEIVMGSASATPTICPASDTTHLCVAVVGPAPIEGMVIQQ